MSESTGIADAGEPTLGLAGRWSGAAAVPEPGPRRSMWTRLRDRVTGPEPADDWATVPAVDPWADHDTPAWEQTYAAPPVPLPEMPPTRLDPPAAPPATHVEAPAGPPPTRLEAPAGPPPTRPAGPAAPDRAAKAAQVANLAADKASDVADRATELAAEAARAASARAEAAKAAVAKAFAARAAKLKAADEAKAAERVRAAELAESEAARAALPAPGTYPPASGSGLPPLLPAKRRGWGRGPKTAPAPHLAVQQRPQTAPPGPFRPSRPVQPSRPAPPPWADRPLPRRRGRVRRWLRRLSLFGLAGLVLCCGGPLAYWQLPVAQQFPVNAVLPDSFADLSLRDTAAGERAAQRLAEQLQETGSSGDAFAGIYTDGNGKRVTLFGVTGWRLTPGSDVDAQLERLADRLGISDVQSYDTGEFGLHESCGTGKLDGTSVVACAWADHGSLATVLLTRRSVEESAELVTQLRAEVLTPAWQG